MEVLKRMNDPAICPPETTVWACDTEVADIELKVEGPVGNGKATCVSIYGGPDVDFGLDGQVRRLVDRYTTDAVKFNTYCRYPSHHITSRDTIHVIFHTTLYV